MKKIIFSFAAIAAITTMAFTTGDPLPIGSPMPMVDIKLKDISGTSIALQDAKKENGLLVMFSCNTCPFVIKNQQRTVAAGKDAEKMKIGFVVLNSNEGQRSSDDSYEAMQAYAKEQHYNWNYVVDKDNAVADAFGANRTPECYLFDKNLILVYHGAIDDNPTDPDNVKRHLLQDAMNELVAGKEITIKTSRSVGCTIKRKG